MARDGTAKPIQSSIPRECHLWSDKALTAETLAKSLVLVKTYEDESHLIRSLKRCAACGHHYFYEFYEIVDWEHGDDAQYRAWIPVDDVDSADRLNALSPIELSGCGGIRADFPSDAAKPTTPCWNMRDAGAEQ